jgi:hypothetical protein
MAQVIEGLPSKCEALCSNSVPKKRRYLVILLSNLLSKCLLFFFSDFSRKNFSLAHKLLGRVKKEPAQKVS